METSEKRLTAEESLALIKASILATKHNLKSSSFYFLLWGWILSLGSITNYFLLKYLLDKQNYHYLYFKILFVWLVFVAIGLIIQFISNLRKSPKEKVTSSYDRFISITWQATGLLIFTIVAISFKADIIPTPFILAITAAATFITGRVIKFIPLLIGSIVFLIAAFIAIFTNGQQQLLVFALAVLLGYIIPGFILKYKSVS